MDEVSRDEKLAHFEAATGILDIEECLAILESCSWNVEEAVKSALEGPVHPTAQIRPREEESNDEESLAVAAIGASSVPVVVHQSTATPFTPLPFEDAEAYDTNQPKRMLEFAVQYGNRVFTITLSDRETIGTLKEQVHLETGVPVAQQFYHSDTLSASSYPYPSGAFPHDDVVLATLQLPKYCSCLLLADPPRTDVACTSTAVPVSVSALTEILASSTSDSPQCNGSSQSSTSDAAVQESSVRTNERKNGTRSNLTDAHKNSPEAADEDEPIETDDFLDAEDSNLPSDEPARKRQANERLMPAEVMDELAAVEHFVRIFEQRYSVRSVFSVSTLADAVQRAFLGPVDTRRPLAIYLHHDHSVFAHLFCTNVLGRAPIDELLRDRFYVVPGDVTLPVQCERILGLLSPHLGSVVTSRFRSRTAAPDQFPVLLLLERDGRALELRRAFHASEVHATSGFDDFVSYLTATRCQFDEAATNDRQMEAQRARREETRREQDAAYSQSAARDAERIAARAEELEAQRAREQRVASARDRLPPEPCADEPDCVLVKFRHADGVLTRRFARTSSLQTLVDYLLSEGFFVPEDYQACFGFPKRFLSPSELHRTLAELLFAAQELVTLERV